MQTKITEVLLKFPPTFEQKFVGRFSPALRIILPEQRVVFVQIFVTKSDLLQVPVEKLDFMLSCIYSVVDHR